MPKQFRCATNVSSFKSMALSFISYYFIVSIYFSFVLRIPQVPMAPFCFCFCVVFVLFLFVFVFCVVFVVVFFFPNSATVLCFVLYSVIDPIHKGVSLFLLYTNMNKMNALLHVKEHA